MDTVTIVFINPAEVRLEVVATAVLAVFAVQDTTASQPKLSHTRGSNT